MRSYGQFCSVARALDAVGERWSLLIVRELWLQGPCRYTDLRNGLPGIATNLLGERLRHLEEVGVVRREAAPPPVATTLFSLTESGQALHPVLMALGRWGVRFMLEEAAGDAFKAHWLWFPVSEYLADGDPTAPPASLSVHTAGEWARIEVGGGQVRTDVGHQGEADLVVSGPPQPVMGLLTGFLSASEAEAGGVELTGERAVLDRLRPQRRLEPVTSTD